MQDCPFEDIPIAVLLYILTIHKVQSAMTNVFLRLKWWLVVHFSADLRRHCPNAGQHVEEFTKVMYEPLLSVLCLQVR